MARQITPLEKHFTASVIVVSEENPKKTLLVHHKKSGTWLQPGGHIEQFENPIEAAIREVKEETGLNIGFLKDKIQDVDGNLMLPTPKFIMQEIVENPNEEKHFHVDLLYVVKVPFQEVLHQEQEAHGIGWFTLEAALGLPMYENTKVLLKQVLTR